MVDSYHDGASGMPPTGLCPAAYDDREVLDVERDEYSVFFCCQREQLLVAEAVELALFVRGANVVASLAKLDCNTPSGDVSVEKELHETSGARSDVYPADFYEWEFFFELLDRTSVFRYRRVDLLWEPLIVVKG